MLEYVILGFLMEGSMSGYDLKGYMSSSTAKFFDASFGSIYPALKRLEDKGKITSRETVEGGKYKKYYDISEQGKEEFFGWMSEPAKVAGGRMEHLLKTFFLNHLEREKALKIVEKYIEGAKKELVELEKIELQIKGHADDFKMSTLYFGKDYYKFFIAWYENFLNSFEKMDNGRGFNYENCSSGREPKE